VSARRILTGLHAFAIPSFCEALFVWSTGLHDAEHAGQGLTVVVLLSTTGLGLETRWPYRVLSPSCRELGRISLPKVRVLSLMVSFLRFC